MMEGRMMNKNYDFSYTQDRELSWLKFNERVLREADKKNVPIFERLKFLEIFTNNLDEFFMVRVGSIHEMSLIHDNHRDIRSDLTPEEQLDEIAKHVRPLYELRDKIFAKVSRELADKKIKRCQIEELEKEEKKKLKTYYEAMILPVLSPIVIGKQHPFPHIPNKVLQIGLILKKKEKISFGIIGLPKDVERMIFLPGEGRRYVLLEDIILYFCDELFENYTVEEKAVLCITRSADINPDDEIYESTDDYRTHMKKVIKMRARLKPVRLEIEGNRHKEIKKYLSERLNISEQDIFKSQAPLDLKYVYKLTDKVSKEERKNGCYRPFVPALNRDFIPGVSVTKQILEEDKLLSFPFDSMDTFIELLKESAKDKETLSIKITIYRLARQARIVKYLCEAAENGKEVLVLMELRARFDEENNINYSEILEEAGCKVMYGMEDYKVHSKVCLITKKNSRGIYYITQIGTGNYNESTSKLYTDLSFMTASEEIGHDASVFFHNMATFNLQGTYEHLLVAPSSLQDGIIKRIEREKMKAESFQPCGIFMKMNSLTDRKIIDELSKASNAGVPIFLLIRGICCIRPGIPGKTENIRVESIVGRFLEHSRIYIFGSKERRKYYIASADFMTRNTVRRVEIHISSADMMTRNTRRRVEVAAPIYDPRLKQRILKMINVMKQDNIQAQVLLSNGEYTTKKKREDNMNSQIHFLNEAKRLAPKEKTQKQNLFYQVKGIFFGKKKLRKK